MGMVQPALELRRALENGDGRKALPLASKNYESAKRTYGGSDPTTLAALGNLAAAQELAGQYGAAEETLRALLPLIEKTPLPKEPSAKLDKIARWEAEITRQTVITNRKGVYNNLARLYLEMGKLSEAEQYCLKALDFMSAWPDANVTSELSVLGGIYLDMGDFAAARKPYEQARDMMLLRFNNGVDKKRGYPYNNLGILEEMSGNPDLALVHLRKALDIRRESLKDKPHPELALSWTNLGRALLEYRPGSRADAIEALKKGYAMGVLVDGASHPETLRKAVPLIRGLLAQSRQKEAATLFDEVLHSTGNPSTANYPVLQSDIEHATAWMALETGHPNEGDCMKRLIDRIREEMGAMMLFSSETRRIGWSRDRSPLGLLVRHQDPLLIAECLLLTKGAVLESVFAERSACLQAEREGNAAAVHELRNVEFELQALREASTSADAATQGIRNNRRSELEEKVSDLRKRIGINTEDLLQSLRVSPGKVSQALAEGTALVDFCVSEPWRVDYSGNRRYGAVLYTTSSPGIRWFDLGEEEEIDQLIAGFRGAILNSDDSGVVKFNQQLFEKILAPLWEAAPGINRWFLCPDGELQSVPFAAMKGPDGTFLAQHTTISLVPSARVLIRPPNELVPQLPKKMLLVGDVDFLSSAPSQGGRKVTSTIAHSYASAGMEFSALPGTAEEVREVDASARQAGWTTVLLEGRDASESAVARNSAGCAIVHLATHGGVLPVLQDRSLPLELPFYSSFVALAGAQATVQQLRQHSDPRGGARLDGFLTAVGAAALPLQDTTLVTLSACESGLGSTEKGEGVLGISRALHSAGARHCLASLWPVDDSATVELMKRFYAGVFQGESPPKALRSAQAALLKDWSETRGLASAMAQAGGFVISSMDVPP